MKTKDTVSFEILEAFSDLLQSKSIDKITIEDITKKAQVSRRTFYNYYSSKNDFFRESISIFLDEITKILGPNTYFDYPDLLKILTYLANHKRIVYSFAHFFPNVEFIVKDYIVELIINSTIENLKSELEFAYQLPYDYALDVYVITIESIIFVWIHNQFKENPETIARYILDAVKI